MKITDEIKRYYDKKIYCPNCGSKDLPNTSINIIEMKPGEKYKDTVNQTYCNNCRWRGCIDKLRSC